MKRDREEVTGERAAILEAEAGEEEDMAEVGEEAMVVAEEATVAAAGAAAGDMTAALIADTIAAKTGTGDPHLSRKAKRSTLRSTLSENEGTE